MDLPETPDGTTGSLQFFKDFIGVDYHSDGHTHIDALCHVAYEGRLYNGVATDTVTAHGATVEGIEVVKDGLVGRGVLLDIPRLRGVSWLEPGEHVLREDLEAAEGEQGVRVGEGDILFVRTGILSAWPSSGLGTPSTTRPGCTPPQCPCSPSAALSRSAGTATATPPRAAPRAWPSRYTPWH